VTGGANDVDMVGSAASVIAATAVSSGRTVLSADQRRFARLPGVDLAAER
jgi:predicted nucleic acid-binding protein